MMAELQGDVPNRAKFNNWIVEIENQVKTDAEEADRSPRPLYRDIETAPDGTDGVILSSERIGKYLSIVQTNFDLQRAACLLLNR
jgi:hypothetical protein